MKKLMWTEKHYIQPIYNSDNKTVYAYEYGQYVTDKRMKSGKKFMTTKFKTKIKTGESR